MIIRHVVLTLGWSENCGLVVCRKIDRRSYQNVNQQAAPSLKVSSYGKTVSRALSVLLTVDWPSRAGPSLLWTRNSALSCFGLQHGSEYFILSSLRVIGFEWCSCFWGGTVPVLLFAFLTLELWCSRVLLCCCPSPGGSWDSGERWRTVLQRGHLRHLALHVGIVWRVVWVRGLYSLETVLFMSSAALFCCVHARTHTHTEVSRIFKTADSIQLGIATFRERTSSKHSFYALFICIT